MWRWPDSSMPRRRRFTSRKSRLPRSSVFQHQAQGFSARSRSIRKIICWGPRADLGDGTSSGIQKREGGQAGMPVPQIEVEPAVLLLVGDNDIEYVVSLRVLALEGRSARFSVIGDLRSHGHHHLAALLHRGLDRVGINALYRDGVGVGEAGDLVVLAVEFCVVLNMRRTPVGVDDLGVDLDALLVGFDFYGGTLRRRPRTVLRLGWIHLPGSGMLIGSRGCNGQSKGHKQQRRCENGKPVGSHDLSSVWEFLGLADWCRRYARKSAESPEDSCGAPRAWGECEGEPRPAKDDRKVGELNSAPRMEAALGGKAVLGEQVHGDFAEIPHDAEPGEDFQGVIGDVNLPPVEALARRSHEVMMVVVPAFAEGEQREQPVVLAGVTGFIAA